MTNMNVNILDVIPPSDAQAAKNILGTVNVQICAPDGIPIARLNGLSVRKSKEGKRFLGMPSYDVGKEGTEKKWFNHFTLFPTKQGDEAFSNAQKARMDAFTVEVLRVLDSGGTRKGNATSTAPATAAAPAKKEPWSV